MPDTPQAAASTSYPTTNLTSLTDSQLRQTIAQLSSAAQGQFQKYVSPGPQGAAAKGGAAAIPTPAAPAAPPGSLNPPPHPLPVVPQALHSTYASRLRTGTTLLMQPILNAGSSTTARASTRRGGMINYAEPGSGDEFPDAGALDSDDSDFVASGGTRTAVRQSRTVGRMGSGMSVFHAGSGVSTPQPQQQQQQPPKHPPPQERAELDQSYLGMIPPSRFIKTKPTLPTAHEYPSLDVLEAHSQKRTSLVPIRVEFETETHRIRDCFVWNLYERLIKPETFAKTFCMDLDLPIVPWAETVANQIRAQLEEHEGVASLDLGVEEYDSGDGNGEELPECRVILSIDVQIATHHLLDHIEWDLLSTLTPERFSQQLCAELGLSGEAVPLIAHAIHEEIMKHKKDAIEWGVIGGEHRESGTGGTGEGGVGGGAGGTGGGAVMKDKTGLGLGWGRTPRDARGPKRLQSVWREWNEAQEFRTRFEELTAEEVERREIERERASRRLRRETSKFQTTRSRRR
ncbi:hypothetical protein F5I97DRAFT_1810951 [Phlebopus sp. FC_14]|nr:hypothetical protein F5I97DRAFT_1810951 [Phlebopus sp. FC_14]